MFVLAAVLAALVWGFFAQNEVAVLKSQSNPRAEPTPGDTP
jgi:hypothetical protein